MRKAVVGSLLLIALVPAVASAAQVPALPAVKRALVAQKTSKTACFARAAKRSRAADTTTWTAPMSGYVNVRMRGARRGNWNLAVFDRASGQYLGSSSAFGSRELVQTWVQSGQRLVVQGCHAAARHAARARRSSCSTSTRRRSRARHSSCA